MNEYYAAIFEIVKTGHWITDAISKELKEYDIYEPQFNVLRILKGAKGKPVSVSTILDNMVQRSSNVTRIVDKLAAKELVERTLCTGDRRKMDIIITKKGELLLDKLNIKVLEFHKPMHSNLSKEEAVLLKELIKKLKNNKI